MKPHRFISSGKPSFDPKCSVCEGPRRDSVHDPERITDSEEKEKAKAEEPEGWAQANGR